MNRVGCTGDLWSPAGMRSTPRRRGLRARKTPPARVEFLVRSVTAPLPTEARWRWASVGVTMFDRGTAGERSSPLQGFYRWSYVGAACGRPRASAARPYRGERRASAARPYRGGGVSSHRSDLGSNRPRVTPGRRGQPGYGGPAGSGCPRLRLWTSRAGTRP